MERQPELAKRARFVFPEAPLSLAQFGFGYGRAWWQIDIDRIAAARDPDVIHRLSQETPEGLPRSRRLHQPLEELLTRLERCGVQCRRPVFRPLHRYLGLDGYPNSEEALETALSIPIYPSLTDDEMTRTAHTLCKELR